MSNNGDNDKKSLGSRATTLTSVTNTLKFFALALLIVEAIIGVLAATAEKTDILTLGYMATFMFIFVVVMVVILAFFRIEALLATTTAELISKLDATSQKVKNIIEYRIKEKELTGGESIQDLTDDAVLASEVDIKLDESKGGLK